MAFNNEIERVKAQIFVLEKKLSLLEEIENHKTPCEEAFKRVYGYYSTTNASDTTWIDFVNGYKSAQEDYKVGTYQEPVEEPEQLKTLYRMFHENDWDAPNCDELCNTVKEWMSQYNCDTNKWDEDYKCGFLDCIDVLRKNLK